MSRDRYERRHRMTLRGAIARGHHDSPREGTAVKRETEEMRLNEISERLKAATPGPWGWLVQRTMRHLQSPPHPLGVSMPLAGNKAYSLSERSEADAAFIEWSRSDVEYLLSALLAARRENETLRPFLRHARDCGKCPIEIDGVLYGEGLTHHECTCGLDAAMQEPR